MVTIPRRGEVGQDARRARPTRFASGGEVESVAPARDPGVRTSPEQFGAAQAQEVQQFSQVTADVAENLLAVENRIRSREDTVARARAVREYNELAATEFRRIQTEADLSDPNALNEYGTLLANQQRELIESHKGSEDSRARLTARLEAIRGSFADQAAVTAVTAQRAVVREEIGRDINDLAANVTRNPAMFAQAVDSLDGIIDDAAPALDPQEEEQFRRAARAQLVVTSVDSFLRRGGIEEAEEVLGQPGMDRFVDPETRSRLRQRIDQAREAMFGRGEAFTLNPGQVRFDKNGRVIAALQDEQQETGFTLRPGEIRFDESGRPIAQAPAEPKTTTLSPGQRIVDQEGNVIAEAPEASKTFTLSPGQRVVNEQGETLADAPQEPKTTTLSPGQRIVDAEGNVIAEAPDRQKTFTLSTGQRVVDEQGQTIVKAQPEQPQSDLLDETGAVNRSASAEIRRQAAQMLGGAFDPATGQVSGLPPERAQAAQQLTAETERILEAGEENSIGQAVALAATRVDVPEALSFADIAENAIEATEEQAEVRNLDGAEARLQREQKQALSVSDATGLGSGVINIFNNTVGQLDPTLVDTDVVTARQRLAMLEGDFINSFNRNPRLPVWEQIRLSRIFSGPSLLRSPEAVRSELTNIDNLLTQQIEANKRLLGAPIPNDQKQEILSGMLTMAQFRKRVREFEVNPAVPAISSAADVSAASPEEVRNFVNRSSTEDLDALPEDARAAIAQKLSGAPGEGSGQPAPPPTIERNGETVIDVDRLEEGREYDIGGETYRFNGEAFESIGPEGVGDQSLLDETGRVEPQNMVATLESGGLPREVAIGFAGNIRQESNFDPNAVGDNGNAFGLFQHNGPRAKALFDFAAAQGEDVPRLTLNGNKVQEDLEALVAEGRVPSAETQVAFAMHELETTESKAAEAIRNASSPEEAARIISQRFFRPGTPHEKNRVRFARQIAQAST